MAEQKPVELDLNQMRALGQRLWSLFGDYKKDRRGLEDQWLKNLRQYKGIWDPEMERNFSDSQSRAYPRVTRQKVIGTVSRLMEMLFPQTEKNWGIIPSPMPDIEKTDLQAILDGLIKRKMAEQESPEKPGNVGEEVGEGEDPNEDAAPPAPAIDEYTGKPVPPTLENDEIEKAIMEFAKVRACRMSKVVEDQLAEIDYVTLAREVVFSAVLFSAGVLKGPLVKKQTRRQWKRGPDGSYTAQTVEKRVPFFESMSIWDYYPDLSAKKRDQQDGHFERHVMSRSQVKALGERPDFLTEVIEDYLRSHASGNYKEEHWETDLRATGNSDRQNVTNLSGRKYEIAEWWGMVTGHELKACGVAIDEKEMSSEFEANVWLCDNYVFKCVLSPYDAKLRPAHVFVFEEDDISLLGQGLPAVMRDSQLAISDAARMLLDNASVVCGPMLEIVEEALSPTTTPDIHAFKIFWRNTEYIDPSKPAVREIKVESHIAELVSIINLFTEFANQETMLPPAALGDPSKGGSEAMRTSQGMSMLMSAAALPIRDTVRNFDKFTQSVIGSLNWWNMEFNEDPTIKGDYTVLARGSTSLIAKEVRSQSLDWFKASLDPEEKMHVNTRKLLTERMKVRDLPLDLLEDESEVEANMARQQEKADKLAAQQAEAIGAEIRSKMAKAFKDFSEGQAAGTDANTKVFAAVMKVLTEVANGGDAGRGVSDQGGASGPSGD